MEPLIIGGIFIVLGIIVLVQFVDREQEHSLIRSLIRWLCLMLVGIGLWKGIEYYIAHKQRELTLVPSTISAPLPSAPLLNDAKDTVPLNVTHLRGWAAIQSQVKGAVVQVFAHKAEFNWLEPYISPTQSQALGTAFFINEDGELITNAHVVSWAKTIWIQMPSVLGKRIIDVTLKGFCPERDIALLQVSDEGKELIKEAVGHIPHLPLGDSNTVYRAEEVLAVGYPLGQSSLKSTLGVVSGPEHVANQYYIQIDAPLNPGSSGGPCLNEKGEVIGINSAGVVGAQNVGYIIPINELRIILDDLHKVPLLRKPFMGVLFGNSTESLTAYLGNPQPGGCFVIEIYKGSPLDKAGVKPFDMIYEINNLSVDLYGDMTIPGSEDKLSITDYVACMPLGAPLNIVVYRYGKRLEFTVRLEQAELLPIRIVYPDYESISYEIVAGMVFMQLTVNHIVGMQAAVPSLTKYLEMKNQQEPALIITHIHPGSLGHRCRAIRMGSVIEEVNGKPVKTLEELRSAIRSSDRNGYVTIKTTTGAFAAFPFKQMVVEEIRLSSDYRYPLTPLTVELLNEIQPPQPTQPSAVLGQPSGYTPFVAGPVVPAQ